MSDWEWDNLASNTTISNTTTLTSITSHYTKGLNRTTNILTNSFINK